MIKKVGFVNDWLHSIFQGHWSNFIIVNVYASTISKYDEVKDILYDEFKQIYFINIIDTT